ncbi:F-box domain containing protein [Trema orientale]|uniref:F-box domain containing protein n=1 Tax=Trema orientale TaxID=63057 RepID=A0A2P5FX72_TREOI|nr:F-box domain containing protein [Trema orientale]
MEQREYVQKSLPNDITLKIASLLRVLDLCALGSCSRFWRELCKSDYLWESLAKERWPHKLSSSSSSTAPRMPIIQCEHVLEALQCSKISDRQVCVKWWKIGRWFYGFRMRDESRIRSVSLADLTTAKEEEVLAVLYRGAIHEVLRVQISISDPSGTPWYHQITQNQV